MSGVAVTVVESGGLPITAVESGAPLMTVVESGGLAVTIAESGGMPFVVEGLGPALQLAFPDAEGGLAPAVTFTRGSTASYFDAAGALQSAAVNAARFDHDPVSLASLGLLIEPARTNLALRSNDFANASWSKTSTTVAGEQLTFTAGGAELYENITVTASTQYTFSFWAKRGTATGLKYCIYNNSGATFPVADTSYYAQTNSSTWTRISVTFTTPVGCTSIRIYPNRSGVTGTMFLRYAQLEAGASATSYIPTVAATVTRSADVAKFTPPADVDTIEYTFDDDSTQQVSVTPSAEYTIPTNLNRARIKSIVSVE